ncbi:OLC1v1024706C1 [Oldenlandia corymbosa var. corymbosa]|uniref:OLC1v1024706C1 n=1 Tax=Oldenlandia corymbosa var. corymbosa TaxID=529605 RepID=A0AAV1C4R4_OLDCO|nr:OLC1v1024706C1 [Oldenlandia corymbosa var. corymbosa]
MAAWFPFFLLLLLLVCIFHHYSKNHKNPKKIRRPPGPPGLPLLGNLHQFDGAKPHEFLRQLSNKHGPLMSLKLGKVPVVVISSGKIAKEALKTHDLTFSVRPKLVGNQKLSYDGKDVAFSPFGEYWREMKKIKVVHLLNSKTLQSFRPILDDEVSLLIEEISDLSASNSVVNLSSMAMYLTSTLICRFAFGKKYDKEDHKKKSFDRMLRESEFHVGGYFLCDYLPSLRWIDKVLGKFDRLEKNFKELDLFYEELIEDHLDPNRADAMNDDLLDILIQIKHNQSSAFDLTWDHIKAIITDIFVGGTDTSSAAIVWAMMALMRAPTVMKRAQAEIRDFVGKSGKIGDQQVPYLDAIIKETFRLYPPAAILPRQTMESCRIHGYDIEANTMVFINEWAISRDPESWINSEDFVPERFLNSNIDIRGNDFEVIPFGSGRRGCPGSSLGLLIVKVTLFNLLYSFDWELPHGMRIEDIDSDTLPGLIMHKKNPLCLVPKRYA